MKENASVATLARLDIDATNTESNITRQTFDASECSNDASHASTFTTITTVPAWGSISLPPGYSIDERGISQSTDNTKIAGPIWIKASTRDEYNGDHGIAVVWIDPFGEIHELAVTRDELHSFGSSLPGRLARAGLQIVYGQERNLLKYLTAFDVSTLPRIQAISRVGWIEEADGSLAYMQPPPTGLIAAHGHRAVIYQPERDSPILGRVYPQGTLQDWNTNVLAICKESPLLLFPILVSISGALLRFSGLESGGFHYYGRSSHGKTTAAQAAASVWGNGADPAESPDKAYIHRWNSTNNAFEATLTAHHDSVLILDEIQTCDSKDFGSVIYNMSGGEGRKSLDRNRQIRSPRKWRTTFFSTGEESVLTKIQSAGRSARAGQLVRFIDLPIDGGTIANTSGQAPSETADRLKRTCSRFFGTAGAAFVHQLVCHYGDASALLETVRSMIERQQTALCSTSSSPEMRRAIKRFALVSVAGELAISLGVVDSTVEQARNAVELALQSWIRSANNISDRSRGVEQIAKFIQRHEARFQRPSDTSADSVPRERVGFVGYEPCAGGIAYMFTSDGFSEACRDLNSREVARELHTRGFLVSLEAGHLTMKRDFSRSTHRVYIVKETVLQAIDSHTE